MIAHSSIALRGNGGEALSALGESSGAPARRPRLPRKSRSKWHFGHALLSNGCGAATARFRESGRMPDLLSLLTQVKEVFSKRVDNEGKPDALGRSAIDSLDFWIALCQEGVLMPGDFHNMLPLMEIAGAREGRKGSRIRELKALRDDFFQGCMEISENRLPSSAPRVSRTRANEARAGA